jgi:hypothetical protein
MRAVPIGWCGRNGHQAVFRVGPRENMIAVVNVAPVVADVVQVGGMFLAPGLGLGVGRGRGSTRRSPRRRRR